MLKTTNEVRSAPPRRVTYGRRKRIVLRKCLLTRRHDSTNIIPKRLIAKPSDYYLAIYVMTNFAFRIELFKFDGS